MLAFFFGEVRFLVATLFATFFFARELDFLASIGADHSRTGGPSGSGGRSRGIGNFASERFGFFSGAFPCGYDSFLHTCYKGHLCFYRRRNLIQNHAGCSRTGGLGRSRSIGNFASKRFGSFSGAFPCSYNSFLRTRLVISLQHGCRRATFP